MFIGPWSRIYIGEIYEANNVGATVIELMSHSQILISNLKLTEYPIL